MSNFYKMLFLLVVILSSLISISSLSWIIMWVGLELNLLCVIPLFFDYKKINSSESSFKYFMIQALASTLFIFSMMMNESMSNYHFLLSNNLIFMLIMTSLLMKLGMAPFHFWFPEVIEGLSWNMCLLLLTWQKMAPMILMMMLIKPSYLLIMSILMSSFISSMMGLNQTSMRKIMAYSSINHMAWMTMSMLYLNKIWMTYWMIYSVSNFFLILMFNNFNISYINQLNSIKINMLTKMLMTFNLMSLGGLPPFIGFLPKWMVIQEMMLLNNFVLSWILIMMTLLTLIFYLRLTFSSIMLSKMNSNLMMSINFFSWSTLMNFYFIFSLSLMFLYL